MKKQLLTLGILMEIAFLSFYVIKLLTQKWQVQNLFLDESRVFALTFGVLAVATAVFLTTIVLIYRYNLKSKGNNLYKYILIFAIIFNFSLLFIWNLGSNDLYTHIQRGRMMAKYGANPYTVTYDNFKYDEFYNETRTVWSGQLSIYGPIFTLFGAAISSVAGGSLLTHIVIYKLIYSTLNVLVGHLIYKLTKNPLASLLYLWNPLVIFEIQMNNHFEVLMVFSIVLSLYVLLRKVEWKNYIVSLTILTLGSLTKYVSFILYPFYILYAFKSLKSWKARLLFLTLGGISQGIIIFFSYLPFLDNIGVLDSFLALASGKFISPSITILVLHSIFEFLRWPTELAQTIAQAFFKLFYAALFIKSFLWNKFVEKLVFVKTLALVLAGFMFIHLNLILPWYTLSLVTMLTICYGLSKKKKYITFGFLVMLYSFLLYIRVK